MVTYPDTTRLVAKEVSLGVIRALDPPMNHIGRTIAPFMDVASDDVIFEYAVPLTDGLAPARAEDSEAELAQKDYPLGQVGQASIIDWAIKDRYSPSDVQRWQESNMLAQQVGAGQFPMAIVAPREELASKIARDDATRRRKLDNRHEWLVMSSLELGSVTYNDGKILFTVPWGRPSDQQNQAPASGLWTVGNKALADPIGDIKAMQTFMFNRYGVRMTRAIGSKVAFDAMFNSDRFNARAGLAIAPSTNGGFLIDPNYLIQGWGAEQARRIVLDATGTTAIEYDSVYRTRPIGSNTITNNRFTSANKLIFLPDPADVEALDDTMIGFAKTLTSPHPEGNWTPGFYEWEESTKDPWGQTRGSGIKMFPVFPHMDLTYVMSVI